MTHVAAWSVDSVCNSLLSQLSTASALIASGAARRVLCVQSAAYSRVNDPSISSSRQEGDLAAAVVVGAGTGRIATAWQTDGSCHSANTLQWQTVGAANPWWVQPDAKLLIHFDKSQQPATLQRLQDLAPVVCGAALQEMDQDFHDVSLFIGHQVSAWMLDFISETLGISDDMAFNTFARYGNVNAPGLTASLHEAIAAGRCETGSKVLIFGPAAGLSFGAAVLEW
jgi:3-oxoacyl-[acyl-carrier-protein] synthase-3